MKKRYPGLGNRALAGLLAAILAFGALFTPRVWAGTSRRASVLKAGVSPLTPVETALGLGAGAKLSPLSSFTHFPSGSALNPTTGRSPIEDPAVASAPSLVAPQVPVAASAAGLGQAAGGAASPAIKSPAPQKDRASDHGSSDEARKAKEDVRFEGSEAPDGLEGPGGSEASAWAGVDSRLRSFLAREMVNDHFERAEVASTVSEEYRPRAGREFDLPYLEIPVEELHVLDSGLGGETLRRHVYVEREGRRYLRFFIHPDSASLYRDLIGRYGVKGKYRAAPTSSTRTLLAWDPKAPEAGVFLKLSLDRSQFGLGRVVPDWEVRRSVLVSRLAAAIPKEESERFGVTVIPEFAGAYVDKALGAGSFVDTNQYAVFQHGLIYRDTEFLRSFPRHEIYPLFSLFSMRGGREPLIVEWWRQARRGRGLSFEKFVGKALIEPFVRAAAYLVFEQGIIPDAHGQNVIVAVNPATRRVEHVFFRDVGSMKIDLLLRWVKGLPVDALRSHNAAYDFKYQWASEIAGRPILGWFYPYMFTDWRGQDKSLTPFVPGYDPKRILRVVRRQLKAALERHQPLPGKLDPGMLTVKSVQARVERYVRENRPAISGLPSSPPDSALRAFIEHQESHGQTLELPQSWFRDREALGAPRLTDYGVIYENASGRVRLAFLPPEGVLEPPAESPTHYELELPAASLLPKEALGQASQSPASHPGAPAEPDSPKPEASFPVMKAGSKESPYYQIVDRYEAALELVRKGGKTLKVEVLEDLTRLNEELQKAILRQVEALVPRTQPAEPKP